MKSMRPWVKIVCGCLAVVVVGCIAYLIIGFTMLKGTGLPKKLDLPEKMRDFVHFGMTVSELEDALPEDFHITVPDDQSTKEFDVYVVWHSLIIDSTATETTDWYQGMSVLSPYIFHFVRPCSYNGVQGEPMLQSISGTIDMITSAPHNGDYRAIVGNYWGFPLDEPGSTKRWIPTGSTIEKYSTEVQVLSALLSGQYVPEGCTATEDMTALEEYGDFSLDKTALQAVRAADNYVHMKSGYVSLQGSIVTVTGGYDMYVELAQRCLDAGE